MVMCPLDSFISGASIQFESNQGGKDDTAANGLKILCFNPGKQDSAKWEPVYQGRWGSWGPEQKELGSVVCRAKVRMEKKQGGSADDTTLNGLEFEMCPYVGPLVSSLNSYWFAFSNVPGAKLTQKVEVQLEGTSSKTLASRMAASIQVSFSYHGIGAGAQVSKELESQTSSSVRSLMMESQEVECPNPCGFKTAWQERVNAFAPGGTSVATALTCFILCGDRPPCPYLSCKNKDDCKECCRDATGAFSECDERKRCVLYDLKDYKPGFAPLGERVLLPGDTISDLIFFFMNDRASSIFVNKCSLFACEHKNFQGRCETFTTSQPSLTLDNVFSSAKCMCP